MIHQTSTYLLTAPVDFCEKVSLIIEPVEGAHKVAMLVCGRDEKYWQGNFGSKVCRCSIWVLGLQEELQNNLLPG